MSVKENFSDVEWKQIVAAAPMVGLAVVAASPNGPWGVMKEMFSVGMAMADVVQRGSDNALVNALIDDVKARATRPEKPEGIRTPEDAQRVALAHLAIVAAVVDASAPGDAVGFKQWLCSIGLRVAEASNEGGFFGFGGERVSAAERQALATIATTLGVPGPAGAAV